MPGGRQKLPTEDLGDSAMRPESVAQNSSGSEACESPLGKSVQTCTE